jgi:hypothetical protein
MSEDLCVRKQFSFIPTQNTEVAYLYRFEDHNIS